MLRFKLFSGAGPELEQTVNEWLELFEPDVTQMDQTVDESGTVTICLLFEESFRGQERRLSSERGMTSPDTSALPPNYPTDIPIPVRSEPGIANRPTDAEPKG